MTEKEIKVDAEAFRQQIIEATKKDDLQINAYCPYVSTEAFTKKEIIFPPLVDVEGYANPLTCAFMVTTLENTIEELKGREGVKEMLALINLVGKQTSVTVPRNERRKND